MELKEQKATFGRVVPEAKGALQQVQELVHKLRDWKCELDQHGLQALQRDNDEIRDQRSGRSRDYANRSQKPTPALSP